MTNKKHVHFIGIGGIGISGLARLFLHEGYTVSGTNNTESPVTLDALRNAGVEISLDQSTLPEADRYIYSDAWLNLNPELIEQARAAGKPVQSYFEALAEVANEYYLIAVAGTHGKTTTTAMLIDILEFAGYDPSAIVGSLRTKTRSNFRAGKSKYFVVEADEYNQHMLHFTPDVLVITNLEHEHVDCYASLAELQAAFAELVAKVPDTGAVIINRKDQNVLPVVEHTEAEVIDYSERLDLTLKLKQPGLHNRLNAAAAKAAAAFISIKPDVITEALQNYAGTWRRFEYKGECNGAKVYDDYAHHPTEIKATIAAARELYPTSRLIAIFQPHTYSRTKELFHDFAKSFKGADKVLLLPVYAAREEPIPGVSSRELAVAAMESCPDTTFVETFDEVAEIIKNSVSDQDVVLVMGAGDVSKIPDILTE